MALQEKSEQNFPFNTQVQEKSDESGSRISGKSLVALGLWVDSGKNQIGDILQSDISQVQLNTLLKGREIMVAEFATIVGLLSAFSSERTGHQQLELSEFLAWLEEHNHEDIKKSIESNQATTVSIKALLNKGLVDVHEKLDDISERLAVLSSRSSGFQDLAAIFARESISDQAMEILTLMEDNHSESFLLSNELGAKQKRLMLSPGPDYLCKETRFFQDDLELMLGLGLLVQRYNSKGDPVFYYTRAASRLVSSLG